MQLPATDLPAAEAHEAEFALTDEDFREIARLAHENFGLDLPDSKRALVYSRLARRLRDLSLTDFTSYRNFLHSPSGTAEMTNMLSALTTNVTHFFREKHHFEALREEVLPPLIRNLQSGGRLRIWSAGCSAGQEPYCISATLLSLCPDIARYDAKILATDIDPTILQRAKRARYPVDELEAIPPEMRSILVDKRPEAGDSDFGVSNGVRELVRFGQVNLIGDWPMRGNFDAIFCRNVAIYFDKATQAKLWGRFGDILKPGGFLAIGHSERLSGDATSCFQVAGITSFRKLQAPADDRTRSEGTN